jgi:hypothetical protein
MQANDIEACRLPLRMPSATMSALFAVPLQFLVLQRTGAKYPGSVAHSTKGKIEPPGRGPRFSYPTPSTSISVHNYVQCPAIYICSSSISCSPPHLLCPVCAREVLRCL